MADNKGVITFGKEVSEVDLKKYQDKIARARSEGNVNALKGRDPLNFEPRIENVPLIRNEKESDKFAAIDDAQRNPVGVQPRPPGSPLLSKETAQQLQDMAKAQQEAAQKAAEPQQVTAEEEELDVADFLSSSDPVARILDNPKRRKEIESRLTPMKFEDLLYKDEVRQLVSIRPGEFEVLFRSITPEENMFIKHYVSVNTEKESPSFTGELYALCQLAASIVSINNRDLVSHINNDGTVDEKKFEQKLAAIRRKSGYIIADLSVQYRWFDIRVRKLIQPDDLKNG